MRLWLDDVRPGPEGWVWAKTLEEAKELLLTGQVEEASLDHDLGDGENDGSALVRWMAEQNVWPKKRPRIHSANPVGVNYMRGVIDRYGPYGGSHG